jgi:two-component system nitrate/nitrite response regulator NarL
MSNIIRKTVRTAVKDEYPDSAERQNDDVSPTKPQYVVSRLLDDCGLRARRAGQRQRSVPTFIVDKSPLFRVGLIHILAETRFRVTADCSSLSDLPERTLNANPFLLLVGLDGGAAEVLTQVSPLRHRCKDLRVILLSERLSEQDVLMAIGGGCCYLLKNEISPEVLVTALELVLLGAMVIPQGLSEGLLWGRQRTQVDAPQTDAVRCWPAEPVERQQAGTRLSNRERAILSHLMQGGSNKHIARELAIAEATVKVHVKSLLRKIQAKNRTQAAMWGMNNLESANGTPAQRPDIP